MPVSMMVEHSNRLKRWAMKSRITAFKLAFGHLAVCHGDAPPPATILPAWHAGSLSFRPRCAGSRSAATLEFAQAPPRDHAGCLGGTKVLIARRRCGAVAITLRSPGLRRPCPVCAGSACGQCQHVDLGASAFMASCGARQSGALVDDEQAQVLELCILAHSLWVPTTNVHCAVGQAFQRRLDFLA